MPKVPDEVLQELKKTSIVDYARNVLNMSLRKSGNQYQLEGHDSVFINPDKNLWNRFSDDTQKAGGDIFNFIQYWENCSFTEAVNKLQGSENICGRVNVSENNKKAVQAVIDLPERSETVKRIYGFLIRERKIDVQIVREWIKRGLLYESKAFHECVFTGAFKNKIMYATKVATQRNADGKFDKFDVKGSVKTVGMCIHNPDSNVMQVFESAIDCMSYQSMRIQAGIPLATVMNDTNYLICGGAGSAVSVLHFNMSHYGANINTVILSLDNDSVGDTHAELCQAMIETGYIKGEYKPEIKSQFANVAYKKIVSETKDWNDDLKKGIHLKSKLEQIKAIESHSTKQVSQEVPARKNECEI